MFPKGKLFALVAVFVALTIVTATGAFTTVSADRTAEVNVAGDNAALLQLGPYSGPDSTTNTNEYLSQSGDGNQLAINLAGSGGESLNTNARTEVENVFNITNQGSQAVAVSIDKTPTDSETANAVAFAVQSNRLTDATGSDITFANQNVQRIDGQRAVLLEPGETIAVSIYIDTSGAAFGQQITDTSTQLLNGITINADTDTDATYDRKS